MLFYFFPPFSSLAGPSTSLGRMERQSKTKAAAKIQEVINSPDWIDNHFHNIRQSKQKSNQNQGNRSANNAWQSRMQQDSGSNDDGCREITQVEQVCFLGFLKEISYLI